MQIKIKQWHKDLIISFVIIRLLYVCLTLTQFIFVLIKFDHPEIIKWITYFSAFFDAIFNLIVYILTAFIFNPFNKKPIVLYGMHVDINREVQLLLFTFSIINIITIFASSIIIYLKQLPVIANGLVSNNSIAPPTTATTSTTNTATTNTTSYNNKNM